MILDSKGNTISSNENPVYNNSISQLMSGMQSITQTQLSSEEGLIKNLRYNLISLNRSLLQNSYNTFGIVQTLIDQPVDDSYKKGFEIDILDDTFQEEDIESIKQFLLENDTIEKPKKARKWARLYGGAGLIVDVKGQNPAKEFNIDSINEKSEISFYAADLWELNQTKTPPYGKEIPYQSPADFYDDKPFLFYGKELHRSRVFKVINKEAPSISSAQLRGWGMSELERSVRELNHYFKAEDVLYDLLDETKITVHKLANLNASLMDNISVNKVLNALKAVEQSKNYLNAVITDAENEVSQMQLDFTGIANIMPEIRKGVAGALKMPLTKLFGQSASGFNAGEDDLENYNSMLESEIRNKDDAMLIWMIKIISKKVLGRVPEIVKISFKPLRELTEEQEQNVKDKKFTRALKMLEVGLWDENTFNEYVKTENLL